LDVGYNGLGGGVGERDCMVNMTGYCHLGFLAMLGYAEIAEIALTVLSRHLQLKSRRFDKTVKVMGEVGKKGKRGNDKWYPI
jgi:hypothetical protein